MPETEDPRLGWYRRASENLGRYLQELGTARDALRREGDGQAHATDQLIAEVQRRLEELEKLLADSKPN